MKRPLSTGIRVNLTLPPEVVAVLDRIGAASGTGRATMLREVLIDGLPGLAEMAVALEMAQRKNSDGFKLLAKGIGQLADEATQMQVEFKRTSRGMARKKKA